MTQFRTIGKERIRTIDKEDIDAIITNGKPAGFWMAQTSGFPVRGDLPQANLRDFPSQREIRWTGVVATGEMTLRHHGTFPEVITWLQIQQGIRQGGTRIIDAASRERIWHAGVSPEVPLRIEGAEIKDWKETPLSEKVMGLDGTPVAGRDAEMLSMSRKRGGAAAVVRQAERDERIMDLYNAGETYEAIAADLGVVPSTIYERVRAMKARGEKLSSRRDQAAIEVRDAEILKLALSGLMWVEIAERLGVTPKVVSHRINVMRMKGYHIPNKAKLEQQAKNRERDERVIALVKDGLALSAIARETGEQKRAVSRRLQRLREEGRI